LNNSQVSIIIPTFNRAGYLKQCIDSCLNQTQKSEIIVCDHGSIDNTPEVVKQYGDKIVYVRRELDSGVHFCWLDGILHAKNEWIHLNFDDDWIEPTFIEKTAALITEDVGSVFTNTQIFFEDENIFRDHTFFKMETGTYPSGLLVNYNTKLLTSPCASIIRKEIMIDVLFQGKIPFSKNHYHGVGPDILFSLFAGKEYKKFGFVYEKLAVFRAHKGSITIDAQNDKNKNKKIKNAYNDARVYYYLTQFIEKFKIQYLIKYFLKFKRI